MTEPEDPSNPPTRSTIRWTPSAFRDLEHTHSFLALRDARAAREFAGRVRRALAQLEQHPESGAVADDLEPVGTYRHVVLKHHRLIYMLDQDFVVILRVWDCRRNPEDLAIP